VISESQIIQRYFSSFGRGDGVTLGVGDDGAALHIPPGHELVVSTDTQVAGSHFFADVLPEDIGYRAIAAAASDLAAMAATPLGMTLALTLPEIDELWLHSFSQGVGDAATAFDLPLVGGDLTRGPLTMSVTVMGSVPTGDLLRRNGAVAGDLLVVTGTLGDAACALAMFEGQLPERASCSETDEDFFNARFYRPSPRFEWLGWLRQHAHAGIDISDGLLMDAKRMAEASGVGVCINPDALPLSPSIRRQGEERAVQWALNGGDDYELAVAVPPTCEIPGGMTVVGEFTETTGLQCIGMNVSELGFDHFS